MIYTAKSSALLIKTVVMRNILPILFALLSLSITSDAQELFRSGRLLPHSSGARIWGPNGSSTSVPQEIAAYNALHGYTGTQAVSLIMPQSWPLNPWDNEWARWHNIFDGTDPTANITPIMNANKIVIVKTCYPSSEMVGWGQATDTLTPTLKTNYNYKWHWRNIVSRMAARPQNFFMIWTNAPHTPGNTNANAAALSKQFCEWAKDTLAAGLDPVYGAFPPNIYVFDYFSKLTNDQGFMILDYAVSNSDSHPNAAATELVAPQLVTELFDASIAYEQGGSTLAVNPLQQNVSSSAGSVNFNISTQANWTAQSSASWCTVTASGSGSGTLTANYSENTSPGSRTAVITIDAAGAGSQTVSVIQAGVTATLAVSPLTQNASAAAGSANYSISSNSSWTAQSDADWCTVTTSGSGNGSLNASFTENTALSSRTATITVTAAGTLIQTVTLVQAAAAATLAISPASQSVAAAQGTTNFSVASNAPWTSASNASWCTVTPSGSGNGTLTASYTANTELTSRTATITTTAGGTVVQTVTVIQAGAAATLAVSPASQTVQPYAGVTEFNVASNTQWTATSDATWCTVTPSGSGSGILNATYSDNTSTDQRTAVITISADGTTDQQVTVTQFGTAISFAIAPSFQNVTPAAGSATFTILSNTSWLANSSEPWCITTPYGSGNEDLIALFEENTTIYPRSATITVTVTGAPEEIVTVIQAGIEATLAVTPDQQVVGHNAGTAIYNVSSNSVWSVVSDADWCTPTSSGSGNGNIMVEFAANQTNNDRTAILTVSAIGSSDVLVSLTQEGLLTDVQKPDSQDFKVYPNPTTGQITIVVPNAVTGDFTLGILNSAGTTVSDFKSYTSTKMVFADISAQPAGTYFIVIRSKEQEYRRKIMLNK